LRQVDYLGKAAHFANPKNPEVVNSSFADFCRLKGIPIPSDYRQVSPNREAAFKSASKYDKNQPILDRGAWELAGEWTKLHFQPVMAGARVLPENVVLNEMDKTTSCGFPWNKQFKNKSEFLADEKAKCALTDYWDLLTLPQDVMVPIWTCSQKCEMRSNEKIAENSLRTFTASPFEHSCSLNRVCLDMNNKFYDGAGSGRRHFWSTVGASKFLSGFDSIYTRLDVHPNAFELDESAYDASLFAEAMEGQAEIRFSFLCEQDRSEDNKIRLDSLYEQIIHSVVVLENGELVQKHTGNPSGSSNTIVDNTMILFRLLAYAWIVLCKEQERDTSYEDFMTHVEAALCGDDNTFTVSDDVVAWFNPTSIARVWCGIGVITKTPCSESRPLREVQYLSNGFVYHDPLGVWLPIPEAQKVLCSLMYGGDVDDVRWHYLRACALRIDSWANPTCRSVISGYLEYLNTEYKEKLVGSVDRPKGAISMLNIMSNWKSDDWIEALYCGNECVNDRNQLAAFKTISQQSELEHLQCKLKMKKSKSAKQQQNRKSRRAAMFGVVKGPIRGPLFRNPQPVGGKKKRSRSKFQSNIVGPQAQAGGSGRLGLSGGGNRATNRRTQVIEEDEYIGDVNGSVAFAATAFSANPGQAGTFPWGSRIAALYEKYEYESLEFYYKREVSEFATNGSAGKVILSFDYDASDSAPTTKQQVEDSVPHADGMPCTEIIRLPIDVTTMRNQPARFVRPGSLPANTDVKNYDVGNFYISTYGNVNATVIGELHVRYRVRFSKPVLEAAGAASQSGAFALFVSAAAGETSSGAAYQMKFADSVFNPISAVNTAGSIVLPAGVYLIETAITDVTSGGIIANLSIGGTTQTFGPPGAGAKNYSATSWVASSAASITLTVQSAGATGGDTVRGWVRITYLQAAVLAAPEPSIELEHGFNVDELAGMYRQMQEMQEWIRDSKWSASVQPAGDGVRLKRKVCDESDTSEEEDSTVKLSHSMVGRLSRVLAGAK